MEPWEEKNQETKDHSLFTGACEHFFKINQ